MKLVMIAFGHTGLVSGACFADFGHEMTCVDKDETKIAVLRVSQIPIHEHGLDRLVASGAAAARLKSMTQSVGAVDSADAVFVQWRFESGR